MSERKLHFYCFSFAHPQGNCCTYTGFEHKTAFNRPQIELQKQNAYPGCPPENMVLIAITYLGFMSKLEFKGELDAAS